MRKKGLLGVAFIVLILAISVCIYGINKAYAANTQQNVATKYFYNQLSKDQKVFYDVMEEMSANGDFIKGNVSKEITGLDNLAAKLDAYASGSQVLIKDMGAGRDAFWLDHSELFYVDFDYLSMRVTMDSNGKKHLYIGTGRSDNYINQEFLNEDGTINTKKITDSIALVNSKISSIVEKANAVTNINDKIRIVHNEIIGMTDYTLEYKTNYPYTVRDIYGVFGVGNAVCEGYARALKIVLDKLNIPAVLVSGAYYDKGKPQSHMWLYVQLNNTWYAIDPTFDNTDKIEDNVEVISYKYFLVGSSVMYAHSPSGVISTSEFEFTYPELGYKPQGVGLEIKVVEGNSEDNNDDLAIARISYNGHGYNKAIQEDGLYMILNFAKEFKDGSTVPYTWGYPIPEMYQVNDTDEYLEIMFGHVDYFQVGVTDVAPAPLNTDIGGMDFEDIIDAIEKMTTYFGEPEQIIEVSEPIYNPGETYLAPPYPISTSPAINLKQLVGNTYNVKFEYDDVLTLDEGKQLKVDVLIYDPVFGEFIGDSDKMEYSISDLKLIENSEGVRNTITFKFTPSRLWIYDNIQYTFQFSNVTGSRSEKAPLAFGYFVANAANNCIYRLRDIKMEVYGKPILIDDFDMESLVNSVDFDDISDEEQASLNEIADRLRHSVSLITTETTPTEEKTMNELLDGLLSSGSKGYKEDGSTPNALKTQTYNISLTLCNKQLAEIDGSKVRIMLGFPEGYSYKSVDEGVTFKAYHYIKDENGNIKEIEEIPCTITQYGIIMVVSNFSPFAIAAVQSTTEDLANTKKTVVFDVTKGGSIVTTNKSSIITLSENETQDVKIVANENYEIDEIYIGGKAVALTDNLKEYTLKLNYNDLNKGTTMINVTFVSKSVRANDKNAGVVVVSQLGASNSSNNGENAGGSNNPQTSVMDVNLFVALTICSLSGIIYLIRKKIA